MIPTSFHSKNEQIIIKNVGRKQVRFSYRFENFFHPFVAQLISRLNTSSLSGVMDPAWQSALEAAAPNQNFFDLYNATADVPVHPKKELDVSPLGPYSNYNWELFFHLPLTIAVHLSKSQRFAEARRWFHFIFDPTNPDTSVAPPARYWKFLGFRTQNLGQRIEDIVRLLSKLTDPNNPQSADADAWANAHHAYQAILDHPFQPHAVARARPLAYQYYVVMKYLDNLIAWGDSLFQQDTIETINEATQIYVLAANLLGEQPERVPRRGAVKPQSYADLRGSLGTIGNAMVDLEAQFPFNLALPPVTSSSTNTPLFGMGRTPYFCVPSNDKMLGYWATVANRLFKIRHCMNIEGIVRPLALFDPPLDPGMLVKAAAAGLDIASIVNGLNRPIGPVRCLPLIQKAVELCSEVKSLGSGLLAALEKGDAEHLALLHQKHEIQIQGLTQEVRFLQWKSAEEATNSLLTSRKPALERLRYYQRLLGLAADPSAPETLAFNRTELTEENFDDAYSALVDQYDKALSVQAFPPLKIAGASSPSNQSGASGQGQLYLNTNEDAELNTHLPNARDRRLEANISSNIAAILTFIPEFNIDIAFWGMGGASKIFGGSKLSDALKVAAEILQTMAGWEQDQAGLTSRTGGYERRADDWMLQYNLAAHELAQNGRQILTLLIAEQIARREYLNTQQLVKNAREVNDFLQSKFTNEDLHLWMQGEISRVYYEYYRFAYDTARRAEQTMKQELMRPELDAQNFIAFNYWDGGRKGLLSGEPLHLDIKRMEMAYHDNNKRELELTRHVSLRQLNPMALLALRAKGSCQVTIPEWLYDRDCPGHYMRRIKSVAVSVPSVLGPYTTVNCTLSLLRSSLRKVPDAAPDGSDYLRASQTDSRFVDYSGAVQSVVTSSAVNDSGMFEVNLRDERFLPFEGAGAESTWKIDLPAPTDYPAFDYMTISDVILHVRYTARQGVNPAAVTTALGALFQNQSQLALLFSLQHDFPDEWNTAASSGAALSLLLKQQCFPYFAQDPNKTITLASCDVYSCDSFSSKDPKRLGSLTSGAAGKDFTLKDAAAILDTSKSTPLFLVVRYALA